MVGGASDNIPSSANPVYTPSLSAVKRAVRPARAVASGASKFITHPAADSNCLYERVPASCFWEEGATAFWPPRRRMVRHSPVSQTVRIMLALKIEE